MKKKFLLLPVLLMTFLLLSAIPAQAAASKATVKKLYNAYLTQNKPGYFLTLDIDQDGVKELITSSKKAKSYDYDAYYIYTIKNKKVTYLAKTGESASYVGPEDANGFKKKYVKYSKKYHSICGFSTVPTGVCTTLYRLKKGKMTEYLVFSENYGRYPVFYSRIKGKEKYYSSMSAYDKVYKRYVTNTVTRKKLHTNTAANRKKYL